MTAGMGRPDGRIVGRLRLASQGLAGGTEGLGSVADAVRWMTAMQAQDLQAAMWAVGVRVPDVASPAYAPPLTPVPWSGRGPCAARCIS